MSRDGDGGEVLKCTFCGKAQARVRKIIAGPAVYICNECIGLCNEILEQEGIADRRWSITELFTNLDRYEDEALGTDMPAADARTYTDAATRFVRWLNNVGQSRPGVPH